MATGSVPVAHMVAELDWTSEFPTARLRWCRRSAWRALRGWARPRRLRRCIELCEL